MTEPNTAEEIAKRIADKKVITSAGVKTWERMIEYAMHEHTAQTLDRLKERVAALQPIGEPLFDKEEEKVKRKDVLKLIEEVSDG